MYLAEFPAATITGIPALTSASTAYDRIGGDELLERLIWIII
jgi:hypothetical protein